MLLGFSTEAAPALRLGEVSAAPVLRLNELSAAPVLRLNEAGHAPASLSACMRSAAYSTFSGMKSISEERRP